MERPVSSAQPADHWARTPRRGMTPADLAQVLAVEVLAYSHPWTRGNFIDALAAGYTGALWLDAQGAPIGYWLTMPGVDETHLLNLTVAPAWQRQGLGGAMLAEVAARCRDGGDRTLWLEVRDSNAAAIALYRRFGFAEVGRRTGYYPAGARREDAVVMSLALAAPTGGGDALD